MLKVKVFKCVYKNEEYFSLFCKSVCKEEVIMYIDVSFL